MSVGLLLAIVAGVSALVTIFAYFGGYAACEREHEGWLSPGEQLNAEAQAVDQALRGGDSTRPEPARPSPMRPEIHEAAEGRVTTDG